MEEVYRRDSGWPIAHTYEEPYAYADSDTNADSNTNSDADCHTNATSHAYPNRARGTDSLV